MSPEAHAGGPYALYRYFDSAARLLYIGISGDLAMRDTSHIARSRWMQLTASSAVERHATLEEVKAAERHAIETEHPLFNRQYNDTPEARGRLVAYLAEVGRADLLPGPRNPGSPGGIGSLMATRRPLTPPPTPRGLADENDIPFFAARSCTDRGEACVRQDVPDGCFGADGHGYCVYGDKPAWIARDDGLGRPPWWPPPTFLQPDPMHRDWGD